MYIKIPDEMKNIANISKNAVPIKPAIKKIIGNKVFLPKRVRYMYPIYTCEYLSLGILKNLVLFMYMQSQQTTLIITLVTFTVSSLFY